MKKNKLALVEVNNVHYGHLTFLLDRLKISFVEIRAETLKEPGALRDIGTCLFPGGSWELYKNDMGEKGIRNLKGYIQNGGGYTGICAGTVFAFKTGILTGTMFNMSAIGVYHVYKRKKHAVFAGYKEKENICVLRVNGPFLKPQRPTEALGYYDNENMYASVVARKYGKGRVIGFSFHPEGGLGWGGGNYNPYFFFDPMIKNTGKMLKNAIEWTSRGERNEIYR